MRAQPYPTKHEILYGLDATRIRARSNCATTRAKFAWLNINVCATQEGASAGDIWPPLRSSIDTVKVLREIVNAGALVQEIFAVMCLSATNQPLGVAVVAQGGLTYAAVDIGVVMKPVVLLPSAGFVICHNHPSGRASPSPEDLAFTKRVKQAGELLGVSLLDHIILTEYDSYSFLDHGQL